MPELPDVEVFGSFCREHLLKKKIEEVWIASNRVIKSSHDVIKRHLKGSRFTHVRRHGKYLFLQLSDKYELLLHFGMTGNVRFFDKQDKNPPHAVLTLKLKDGSLFSVISVRKLGKIQMIKDSGDFIKSQELGPDALQVGRNQFKKRLNVGGSIKSSLMNQENISGIGNIYSDEVLYQSAILPGRKTKDIRDRDMDEIYHNMKRIIRIAVKHQAKPEAFPDRYLIKRRKQGEKCGICSGTIKKEKINGRFSYFCKNHQK